MTRATRNLVLSGVSSALLLTAAPVAGATINLAVAACDDQPSCTLPYPGGTLELIGTAPGGGLLDLKDFNGATGLGVKGTGGAEIGTDESIAGFLSSPVTLDAFTVLFLYDGLEFGDVNETAQISINGGVQFGTLTATGESDATWSLGGTVTNCGLATELGTGCFTVNNPFGGSPVHDIQFTAVGSGSDYSLSTLQISDIPEPGALLLFGAGAMAVARRLRRPLASKS